MSRYSNAFDDNFETVTSLDGKPVRVLKDKGRFRVSLIMRDTLSPLQRSVADETARDNNRITDGSKPVMTDGHSTDPLALQRPGWRIPVVNDRRVVTDTYRRVELGQTKAYRLGDSMQCSECFGSGEGPDGEDCDACNGTGIMPERSKGGKGFGSTNEGGYDTPDPASDSRTHRQTLDKLYRERDEELSNMWRNQ